MYIPEGYGTVFPYIVVINMNRFIDFLKAVFKACKITASAEAKFKAFQRKYPPPSPWW